MTLSVWEPGNGWLYAEETSELLGNVTWCKMKFDECVKGIPDGLKKDSFLGEFEDLMKRVYREAVFEEHMRKEK